MSSYLWQSAVIFGAAFVAGMINSIAGGGTLLSFPALIWIGRDPILANATSTVALWPGTLGAMVGYRRELAGSRAWMLRLAVPSFVGGLAGAMLLWLTPSHVFAAIVPFLILFATILFAVQEPVTRVVRGRSKEIHPALPQPPPATNEAGFPAHATPPGRAWWVGAIVFQLLVAIYGGYFGAGIGILMLAALGLLGLTDIHHMNGLKNFFALCINGIAAAYFVAVGAVNWPDALIMSTGAIIGGYAGAGLARKLGRTFVRRAVIVIGLAMAISLLLR